MASMDVSDVIVVARCQATVQEDPVAWWRHAINATRHACRSIRRHQAPLRTIERRRRARLAYQALYAAARCGLPSFQVRHTGPPQPWAQSLHERGSTLENEPSLPIC